MRRADSPWTARSANATTFKVIPKINARAGTISPCGNGRDRVRRMSWSRSRSIQQLMVRAAGRHGAADNDGQHQADGGYATAGQEHGRDHGDQQQLDDAGFREPRIRAQRRRQRATHFDGHGGVEHDGGAEATQSGVPTDHRPTLRAAHATTTVPLMPTAAWPGIVHSNV